MSGVISPGAARLPHCSQAGAHSSWYPTTHSNQPLWYHLSSVVMGTVADTIYSVASQTQTKVNNFLHSYNSLLYPTCVTILGPNVMLLLFLYHPSSFGSGSMTTLHNACLWLQHASPMWPNCRVYRNSCRWSCSSFKLINRMELHTTFLLGVAARPPCTCFGFHAYLTLCG